MISVTHVPILFHFSYTRGNPFEFYMGLNEVITGIDVGMRGMCVGEKRNITIPPSMGYGNRAVGECMQQPLVLRF